MNSCQLPLKFGFPTEVERVVPNALFDDAIRKRLEDKRLGKLGALSLSNGSLHPRCCAK
jgi:hypothetical protein